MSSSRRPHKTLTQIWDPTGLLFDQDTGLPTTGRWRDLRTTDLAPFGGLPVPVSGGTYLPFVTILTSGQVEIPAGAKTWSVGIISGSAFVNGAGPISAQTTLGGGQYDGRFTLGAPIVVGCTGGSGSPCKTIVLWEA